MTNRIKGLVITLDQDIREDDIKSTVSAIKMIKGVQDVEFSDASADDVINRSRVKMEIIKKFYKFLEELTKI